MLQSADTVRIIYYPYPQSVWYLSTKQYSNSYLNYKKTHSLTMVKLRTKLNFNCNERDENTFSSLLNSETKTLFCPTARARVFQIQISVLVSTRQWKCSFTQRKFWFTKVLLLPGEHPLTLHLAMSHISHVVTRFSGDGAVVVRCMFLISLDSPYFHSMSDCACDMMGMAIVLLQLQYHLKNNNFFKDTKKDDLFNCLRF